MHSNCNQCRQLSEKQLSFLLDVLQLFHLLIPLITAAKRETQGVREYLRQVLNQIDQKGVFHHNIIENEHQT
jgi:hypothetical protein